MPHLQRMFTPELEHHAQAILKQLECEYYTKIMRDIVVAIPNTNIPQADKFKLVQAMIAKYLPESARQPDLLQRLAVIMTLTVIRKHEDIVSKL